MKDVWWAAITFREFVVHFIEMTDAEIVADVRASITAVLKIDESGNSFGAKMVGLANRRLDNAAARASRSNGSKGGRPRKRPQDFETAVRVSGSGDAPVQEKGSPGPVSAPADTDELYAFAAENGLDEIDAREWYEMTAKRGWRDRYGNPIRDWKLACEAYCARKALNRLKKEDK